MSEHTKNTNPGTNPRLAAAITRDNELEDAGMHGDDRITCWTHRCWADDCADRHVPARPAD
ncbi:hypothetical protein [Streptomyces sp. SID3343]|uniref:hypothetical protein n=1 Tax=Streptomyces sp. SID3343 TaxID=2690260 RepID=UPI0013680938|nr:hypothetical protein [Streptomyces sp. SID3343]MYW06041.1 hypothetical protein [Streptomyces sp. SID3343]